MWVTHLKLKCRAMTWLHCRHWPSQPSHSRCYRCYKWLGQVYEGHRYGKRSDRIPGVQSQGTAQMS